MITARHLSIAIVCFLLALKTNAQNIGINTTGAVPAASAVLDLVAADKGLLVPRVLLTATNSALPVAAPAASLLVYNTATAGVAPNNVTPGYYYWDGAAWVRVGTGNPGWTILGNAGTVVGTNFLGTTDNVDLQIRTNNIERIRVRNNGYVGINVAVPTLAQLEVASGTFDAINGHSIFYLHFQD